MAAQPKSQTAVPGEPRLWEVLVVHPLRIRERINSARLLVVLADSPEQAKERAKAWDGGRAEWIGEPTPVKPVQVMRFLTVTKSELAKMKGESLPAQKPKPAPKLSNRKLGQLQMNVLQSLKQHGTYPGGWIWGSASATERTLESLVQRCLVNKTMVGKVAEFTLNAQGLAAIEAAKGETSRNEHK